MSAYPFLSDEWIEQARALRQRYEDKVPPPPTEARLNIVVTDIPHRADELRGHIDSTTGQMIIEQGHLDQPDLTVTVDYATAKAAFVTGDQQAVMQAFIGGRIMVEGDVMKLIALQASQVDPIAIEIHEEMQRFTTDD